MTCVQETKKTSSYFQLIIFVTPYHNGTNELNNEYNVCNEL